MSQTLVSASTQRMMAALGAGWTSRVVRILLNLTLTPVLFAGLGDQQLGVWFTMQSAIGVLALLDLGLTSTLPRRFAFARGATDLESKQIRDDEVRSRVQDLLATGNRLYVIRLLATLIIGAVAGYATVVGLDLDPALAQDVRWAWALLVVGQAAQLWGAAWSSALIGFGLTAWQIGVATVVTALGLVAQIAVVSAGYGLVELALVVAPLPVIQRQTTIFVMRRLHPEIESAAGRWNGDEARSMLRPSIAAWLVSLSALAILRVDNFFISGFLGVEEVPPYFAAMQVYNSVHFMALAVFLGATPVLSQHWAKGNSPAFRAMALKLYRVSLCMAAAGAGTMLGLGQRLFELWLGPGAYVGDGVLALIALRLVFDTHQAALLGAARSTEFEVFTKLAIIGAALSLAFAFVLTPRFGVPGLVGANLLAQGLTLHTFGAARAVARIGLRPVQDVARRGLEAGVLGMACCGVTKASLLMMPAPLVGSPVLGEALFVIIAASASGLMVMVWLWNVTLQDPERRRVIQIAKHSHALVVRKLPI